MREIKFRAMFRGKWIYFTIDDLLMIDKESMTDIEYTIIEHDPSTRCQYTGLTDKNGKEIYEGDIVKTWIDEEMRCIGGELSSKSIYSNEEVKYETYGFFAGDYGLCEFETEVIGNIYETPELLEGGVA